MSECTEIYVLKKETELQNPPLMCMIQKRDGTFEQYDRARVRRVIHLAFEKTVERHKIDETACDACTNIVESILKKKKKWTDTVHKARHWGEQCFI